MKTRTHRTRTRAEHVASLEWNVKDAREALRNAVDMSDHARVRKYTAQIERLERKLYDARTASRRIDRVHESMRRERYHRSGGARDPHRSTWEGKHETGHFTTGGRTFSAGGASIDAESGRIAGYPKPQNQGYVLTTWGGEIIGPLRLVRTWKQHVHGRGITRIYAWSMRYEGRTFTGRNGGPGTLLRLKHATARDARRAP